MDIKIPPLEIFFKYKGAHCRNLWAEVGDGWICPACGRNKFQIMRWTTRFPGKLGAFKDWIALLHRHHDHSQGFMSRNRGRFPETVICDQCNSSDGAVKRKFKLPSEFSFSPREIAEFISATPHGKHKIDFDRALRVYYAVTV
jgi:hypothetical protein